MLLCAVAALLYASALAEPPETIYEYAFVLDNGEYQIYYVFDTDEMIVRNFYSNDTGVMVGTFTGDESEGFSIHWIEGWDESFQISDNDKAMLIDSSGFEWEYTIVPVEEAEAVLNQEGYKDMKLE